MVVNSAVPRVLPLSCVAGNTLSLSLYLEGLHTAPFVGLCSARSPAIVHGGTRCTTCIPSSHCAWRSSRHHPVRSARAEDLVHQWVHRSVDVIVTRMFCSGAFPQLPSLRLAVVRLPASASGVHSRRSSVVATLRSCRRCGWLCASWSAGHSSTQTCSN